MKDYASETKSAITLEEIARRRTKKLEEVRQARERMSCTVRELFASTESGSGTGGIMQQISAGIAVYDGIRTGFKVMRRVKNHFRKRRR